MSQNNLAKEYQINPGPLKVELIKVLKGANYFSAGPVVLTRINLGEYDEVFSNEIDGFYESLENILPSLYDHHCSEGKPGGFFFRVRKGTLMGHVIEHVAIELQSLAGMEASYGKTRSTLAQGIYNIIFRFIDDQAGIYAAKAAVNLVNAILQKINFDVKPIIESLIKIREERLLGPSTQAIVDEAIKRDIPVFRLDQHNLIQLGTGKYHKKIRATITSDTHFIAVENVFDKFMTTLSLKDSGLPVAETYMTNSIKDAITFYKSAKGKIVIKPVKSAKGQRVFTSINSEKKLRKAFKLCQYDKEQLLLQKQAEGYTYRILVINGLMVAATKLTPPEVKGDGVKSINQLVQDLNNQPHREPGDKGKLSFVEKDEALINTINLEDYKLESIIPNGEILRVKSSGNPTHGAISEDVTIKVHPENRYLAERAASICGLNVAGITIITKDIGMPITETFGIVLDVSAGPDFRMHLNPFNGQSINPAIPMLDMLFPPDTKSRVPLISITGSAGKSVCAYLVNFALEKEGYKTGLACSDGLFSAGKKIISGNMTYPEDVPALLGDPALDCAIVETSVEGILNDGLGYQFADIGVFLNVYENHLNQGDIKFLEDLTYAKSVVAEEVYEQGVTVLNADCDMIMDSLKRLYSKPALFSKDASSKIFSGHITKGGMGVCIREGKVFLHYRSGRWLLAELKDIPLAFSGKTEMFFDSILAACCILAALGVKPENIGSYIKSFKALPHIMPGRMNFTKIGNREVLIDNPSNEFAFSEIKKAISDIGKPPCAIIVPQNNIEDEEIRMFAQQVVKFADKIVIIGPENKEIGTANDFKFNYENEYIISLDKVSYTSQINKVSTISKKLFTQLKSIITLNQKVEIVKHTDISSIIKEIPENYFPVFLISNISILNSINSQR